LEVHSSLELSSVVGIFTLVKCIDGRLDDSNKLNGPCIHSNDFDSGSIVNREQGAHSVDESGDSVVSEEVIDVHGESGCQLNTVGQCDSDFTVWIASDNEVNCVVFVEELVAST
jgi:hypothetical protein